MSTVHIIDRPMIQHKLSIMRDKNTGSKDFRQLLTEISLFMGYEVTRDLPLDYKEIETPICKMKAPKVSGRKLAIVPILRAGMGMLEGMLTLIQGAFYLFTQFNVFSINLLIWAWYVFYEIYEMNIKMKEIFKTKKVSI